MPGQCPLQQRHFWQGDQPHYINRYRAGRVGQKTSKRERWQRLRRMRRTAQPDRKLPHFALLQLQEAALLAVAAHLTKQDQVALGLALPKGSAAAVIVLGNIRSIVFCPLDPDWLPSGHACVQQTTHRHSLEWHKAPTELLKFLTALSNLQKLSIEFDTKPRGVGSNLELLPGYPRFASLAAVSGLTSLSLTAMPTGTKKPEKRGKQQRSLLDVISTFTNLRELEFSAGLQGRDRWKVAGALEAGSVAMLSTHTKLQSLKLQYVASSCCLPEGLQQLSVLTSLTSLVLEDSRLCLPERILATLDKGMIQVDTPPDHLLAWQPLLSKVPLQKLAFKIRLAGRWFGQGFRFQADGLRALSLSQCSGLIPAFEFQLSQLTALQELHVSACRDLKTGHLAAFAGAAGSRLTLLDISNNGIDMLLGSVEVIKQLPGLQHLSIAGTCIGLDNKSMPWHVHAAAAADGDGAAGPENVYGNAGACQAIAALTGLTCLALGGRDDGMHRWCESCMVPPEELSHLSGLTNLRELVINQNTLVGWTVVEKAAGLAGHLSLLTALKSLALNGCGLREEDESSLLESFKLQGFVGDGLQVSLHAFPVVASGDNSDSGSRGDLLNDSESMSWRYCRSDGGFETDREYQNAFGAFLPAGPLGGAILCSPQSSPCLMASVAYIICELTVKCYCCHYADPISGSSTVAFRGSANIIDYSQFMNTGA